MSLLGAATIAAWLLSLLFGMRALTRAGWLLRLRRLLAALICAVLGLLCGSLLMLVHAFSSFAGEALVATVTTQRVAPKEFMLTYQLAQVPPEAAQVFQLRGDQWAISGGIVKWHPWLTAVGLPSYHKPLRISGQFSHLDQQRAQPPTVDALAPGTDWFWEALYRADPYLPFVEAVYGSSAFVYVEPETVQEVYVTPSGYLIKRKR